MGNNCSALSCVHYDSIKCGKEERKNILAENKHRNVYDTKWGNVMMPSFLASHDVLHHISLLFLYLYKTLNAAHMFKFFPSFFFFFVLQMCNSMILAKTLIWQKFASVRAVCCGHFLPWKSRLMYTYTQTLSKYVLLTVSIWKKS